VHWIPARRGERGARRYVVAGTGAGPGGGYSPAQLATAYGYTPSSSVGATQTVALVDAFHDPYARTELNAFDSNYGLAAETTTSFRQVNQTGGTTPPKTDTGWSREIALDVQAVRAVCHRCKILLVEANSDDQTDLAAAVNTAARLGATEISNSYGGMEPYTPDATTAAAYNHRGIVITASTGDEGWYDWDLTNAGNDGSFSTPELPAAYPTVIAVGGTKVELDASGARTAPDSVWNDNGAADAQGVSDTGAWLNHRDGASGGGCSTLYPASSWQKNTAGYDATGCNGARLATDIAVDAAPSTGFSLYSHYDGGWTVYGGTSLASPLVAAMWALAGGSGGVSYPSQSLYDHLNWTPAAVQDVAVGGNGFCGGAASDACATRVQTISANAATNGSGFVRTLSGLPTGNPNNLVNDNPWYPLNGSTPPSWTGLLDCGFEYPTYDDQTHQFVPAPDTAATGAAECNAGTGFDGPSGVGSPNGTSLFTRMGPKITLTGPSLLKAKTSAKFSATGFSDNIPGATAASYTWTWGDGTSTTTTSTAASHAFGVRGTYTITLRVTDSSGRSYSTSKRYTLGYAPSVAISGYTKVTHGVTYTWKSVVTEHNTGGKITGYTWRIGSTIVGHGTYLRHSLAKGTRYITLNVIDNSYLVTSKRITVTVV
jgi:subtilase family serine protease